MSILEGALGSKLKRLSDFLFETVTSIYAIKNIPFQSQWFPLFSLLYERKVPLSIMEISEQLGQNHSTVSKMSKKMIQAGLICDQKDPEDERRRLLSITPKGHELLNELLPLWSDIMQTFDEYIESAGGHFYEALEALEQEFKKRDLVADVLKRTEHREQTHVTIIPYSSEYQHHFKELNVEWIETFFYVDQIDDQILSNPEQTILQKGGHIFFAKYDDQVIGTCALLAHHQHVYELAYVAVTPKFQGLKAGQSLFRAVIDYYHHLQGQQLYVETNPRLERAYALCEHMGFVVDRSPEKQPMYARFNTRMILQEAPAA